MLAYFFNSPTLFGIFRVYAGYISLLPNLIGYLTTYLSITKAPFLLTWYPLLVAGIAHTLFALRRFRIVLPSDQLRILVCILLTILPIGDVLLYSNSTYSIWNLLWILLLLAYAPLSLSPIHNIVQLGFMLLLTASHALSFLIIPICLYNLYSRRTIRDWLMNIALLLIVLIYAATAIVTTDKQFANLWGGLLEACGLVMQRVIAESLIGYQWRMKLYSAGYANLLNIVGLFVLSLFVCFAVRHFKQLKREHFIQLGFVIFVIVAITILTVLARSTSPYSLWGPWELRYFYVQQKLFWLVILIALVLSIKEKVSWTARSIYSAAIFTCLSLLIVSNGAQFQTSRVEGRRLAEFLHTVEMAVEYPAFGDDSTEFVLPRSCFDIHLVVK